MAQIFPNMMKTIAEDPGYTLIPQHQKYEEKYTKHTMITQKVEVILQINVVFNKYFLTN